MYFYCDTPRYNDSFTCVKQVQGADILEVISDGLRVQAQTAVELSRLWEEQHHKQKKALLRQFGPENWTLYKGKHLLSFVDNHDVTRIASNLTNERHLPLIYAMAFGMPGIPCVYYGSEWGAKANKSEGDPALRPCFAEPLENELTQWIARRSEERRVGKECGS